MTLIQLHEIINSLIDAGIQTIKNNCKEHQATIDYVAIFSKNEDDYQELEAIAETIGTEVDKETIRTGRTFLLTKPLMTPAGILSLIKIRKPDATRPQRGAPDFKIKNYQEFKDRYIRSSGNFTLMLKKDYEMIEIKGINVLVYIPSKPLTERMSK